ncbi:MAG: VWA domain-containing protein [Desulfovibrio sp.]|nr:MAG: VWA domain-containing protein [Desulfovibrio sp.]
MVVAVRQRCTRWWALLMAVAVVTVCYGQAALAQDWALGGSGEVASFRISQAHAPLPALSVFLEILDSEDDLARNLDAEDFAATVGGNEAAVLDVRRFSQTGQGVGYVFLVDVSRSLDQTQFASIRESLLTWIGGMGPQDQASLVTFGDQVVELTDFTSDKAHLVSLIELLQPTDNTTQLYAGLARAMDVARSVDPSLPARRVIVTLSDGEDDAMGAMTREEVLEKMGVDRIPIYAVGYGANEDALKDLGILARTSGGVFFTAGQTPIPELFAAMHDRIGQVFVAALCCPNCVGDFREYHLSVTLATGDRVLEDSVAVRLVPLSLVTPCVAGDDLYPDAPLPGQEGGDGNGPGQGFFEEAPSNATIPGGLDPQAEANATEGPESAPEGAQTENSESGEAEQEAEANATGGLLDSTVGAVDSADQGPGDGGAVLGMPWQLVAAILAGVLLLVILTIFLISRAGRKRDQAQQGPPAMVAHKPQSSQATPAAPAKGEHAGKIEASEPGAAPASGPRSGIRSGPDPRSEPAPFMDEGPTQEMGKRSPEPARAAPVAEPASTSQYSVTFTEVGGRADARRYHGVLTDRLTLGRAPGSVDIIVADDDMVSGRHCELILENSAILIRDLGSTNGTFVNGVPLAGSRPLNHHDLIMVGGTELRVSFHMDQQ